MEMKCKQCDTWFSSVSALNRHFREKHERNVAKFHKCSYCEKQFPRRSSVSLHIQSMHTKPSIPVEKEFKCSTCEKGFDKMVFFERHRVLCEKKLKLDSFSCYHCGRVFKMKNTMKWHIIKKHVNQNAFALCDTCGAKFEGTSAEASLKLHIHQFHTDTNSSSTMKCVFCINTFPTRDSILNHLAKEHDISILHEHLTFPSIDQFQEWRRNLEKTTFTSFYCRGGLRQSKNHCASTYICHRSGNYQPKTEGRKRKIKHQGTKKTGSYCPAEINLRISQPDGICKVSFVKLHLGHNVCDENELPYIPIPQEERAKIASQIASGLSFDEILMQHSLASTDRIYTLTRKDLYNISSGFCLREHGELYKSGVIDSVIVDDIELFSQEVDMESSKDLDMDSSNDDVDFSKDLETKSYKLVESVRDEDVEYAEIAFSELFLKQHEKSILFLKKSGETNSSDILRKEDFFMVMMTEKQKQTLQKFGSNVISVDATFTLSCDFLFLSLLIIDNYHVCVPVAFAVSTQRDFNVVELFLSCVRKKMGLLNTQLFMSDVEFDLYRSWRKIMAATENRSFCKWDGSERWRRKLKKISRAEHSQLADQLYEIITQRDSKSFYSRINAFFANIDHSVAHPLSVLKRFHFEEIEKWAKSFRETVALKVQVESVNQKLRYFYEKLANVKSLDSVLTVIDNYLKLDELNRDEAKKILSSKLDDLQRGHEEYEKCGVVNIERTSDGGWYVSVTDADSDLEDVHFVNECHDSCCECRLVCKKCNTCAQKYRCSCVDNATKNRMCKHIHALCMYSSQTWEV